MVCMDIQTVMVGMGPLSSLVVLKPRSSKEGHEGEKLPIRVGMVEASAISAGIEGGHGKRPLTHDLMLATISQMGGTLQSVEIVDVQGTTFFARLNITCESGRHVDVDARPSDALALAVRAAVPIFADERVLQMASMPDFDAIEHQEREQELQDFHDFVQNLSPDDFK